MYTNSFSVEITEKQNMAPTRHYALITCYCRGDRGLGPSTFLCRRPTPLIVPQTFGKHFPKSPSQRYITSKETKQSSHIQCQYSSPLGVTSADPHVNIRTQCKVFDLNFTSNNGPTNSSIVLCLPLQQASSVQTHM